MEAVKAVRATGQKQYAKSGKMGHFLFPNFGAFAEDLQLMNLWNGEALNANCPLKQVESLSDEGTCHNYTTVIRLCLKDTVSSVASSMVISAYITDEINPRLGIEIWNRSSTGANHGEAPFESVGVMVLTLAEGMFHLLLFNCRQNDISLFDSYQRDNHSRHISLWRWNCAQVISIQIYHQINFELGSLELYSVDFLFPSTVQVVFFFFQNFKIG